MLWMRSLGLPRHSGLKISRTSLPAARPPPRLVRAVVRAHREAHARAAAHPEAHTRAAEHAHTHTRAHARARCLIIVPPPPILDQTVNVTNLNGEQASTRDFFVNGGAADSFNLTMFVLVHQMKLLEEHNYANRLKRGRGGGGWGATWGGGGRATWNSNAHTHLRRVMRFLLPPPI
jgi:hypothetical protein